MRPVTGIKRLDSKGNAFSRDGTTRPRYRIQSRIYRVELRAVSETAYDSQVRPLHQTN